MEIWRSVSHFSRFAARVVMAHFVTYVVVGGASYLLIMRHCWASLPADLALWDLRGPHVQLWIWPAQFVRGLVLAAVFYPFREALERMGRWGGLAIAGVMIGIGCVAGFGGLIENLVFYRNASLYLYYIHIPELVVQTVAFGYLVAEGIPGTTGS